MGYRLKDMDEADRAQLMTCVTQIRKLSGVTRVVLFGSYAKGTAGKSSDIDLAVFMETDKNCLLEEYRIIARICIACRKDVQVQVFRRDELDEPCGIIQEIVDYGIDLAG